LKNDIWTLKISNESYWEREKKKEISCIDDIMWKEENNRKKYICANY